MAPPFKKRKINTATAGSELRGNHKEADNKQRNNALQHKADNLLESRKKLPIWEHADEIRKAVKTNDVVLLVGETGSGKSTQIPQFLVSENWCKTQQSQALVRLGNGTTNPTNNRAANKIGGRIAIIQPRRVAAISLATRVAAEVGTPLGSASPASTVGYSVRFDNNVSPSNKIKFLTDGMLLQELLRDPWLHDYSCVIVDEVHERGINVDLVLGFLHRILDAGKTGEPTDGRHGVPLKVVVMSATAEMESIENFFRQGEALSAVSKNVVSKPARDETEWTGFSDAAEALTTDRNEKQNSSYQPVTVSSCYIKGRQYPVTTAYTSNAVTNLLDSAMEKIIHIHRHQPLPGDILVFLSGQEMIENLETLCYTYGSTLTEQDKEKGQLIQTKTQKQKARPKLPALQILPLFASLPTHLQSRIFQSTPHFTRRIILATNIAETSITVPGIRHVIDTGKHKSRLFRPGLNLDTLLSTPISQSMAKQRAGRAGREAPGTCHRLYTQKDYFDLEKDTKPEILSTDLAFLVLTLKAHGVNDVLSFPLLTKPPRRSLEAALEGLLNLNALNLDDGSITDIGRKMAMLPVRPDLARILLESTKYSRTVTEGIVDIVSALSLEEGIFLPIRRGRNRSHTTPNSSMDAANKDLLLAQKKKSKGNDTTTTFEFDDNDDGNNSDSDSDHPTNPIESARRTLLSRHSDHLTLLNTIHAYTAPTNHDRRTWCNEHGVSHRAMSRIMDVRRQLNQMISSSRFRLPRDETHAEQTSGMSNTMSDILTRESILKCLVAGLWTNVALLTSMTPSSSSSNSTLPHHAGQQPQNPNQRAPYTTLLTGQGIHVHPSSVVFTQRGAGGTGGGGGGAAGKKGQRRGQGTSTGNMPRAIVFTDLVYTSKAYARNVSAVELAWVAERGQM